MSESFRVYSDAETGKDGYPLAWHKTVKHLVREQAGHRCIRCGHPYPPGIAERFPRGEWTPCDDLCTHGGPMMHRSVLVPGESLNLVICARYRILTVHHFDGIKTNLRWWNLGALCQRCHLIIQGRVRLERPWPWQHSEWFKPYAAGFYASHILGEELTREQTEERLAELLEIGANHAAVERMVL